MQGGYFVFQGFTEEAGRFYWELLFNNEREWFIAHKAEFLRLIKEPMDALAKETLAELQRRHPEREWMTHVSRIYRDARRLFGRGPYKEHMWFTVRQRSDPEELGFWFEFGPKGYAWGLGAWANAAQMEHWRAFLDADPAGAERVFRRFARQKITVNDSPQYKRPKGEKGKLLDPWYNAREITVTARRDFGGDLFKPELPLLLADEFDRLLPLYDLLRHIYD